MERQAVLIDPDPLYANLKGENPSLRSSRGGLHPRQVEGLQEQQGVGLLARRLPWHRLSTTRGTAPASAADKMGRPCRAPSGRREVREEDELAKARIRLARITSRVSARPEERFGELPVSNFLNIDWPHKD